MIVGILDPTRDDCFLLLCLWGSRAKVCRGAKLDFQCSAHLAIHSLEGEAGCSACSPDPVEGGEKLVKLTSIGVKHCVGNHGSHFWSIF